MAEAGLLEEALAKYGGNKWSLTISDSLKCGMKDVNSMEEPISLPAFIRAEKLLPLLYTLFMNFAFMLLGWPGVRKTPAIIIMMLAMGRYHASRLDLPTPPDGVGRSPWTISGIG